MHTKWSWSIQVSKLREQGYWTHYIIETILWSCIIIQINLSQNIKHYVHILNIPAIAARCTLAFCIKSEVKIYLKDEKLIEL